MKGADQPRSSDLLVVLGTNDSSPVDCCVEILKHHSFEHIVITGGVAHQNCRLMAKNWNGSEAQAYEELLREKGIDTSSTLLETKAQNTGDNVTLTRDLLAAKGIEPRTALFITKPFMARRSWATAKKQWPALDVANTFIDIEMEAYVKTYGYSFDDFANILVGDFQRMKLYPDLGFQVPVSIPENVWAAFERLVEGGYDQRLAHAP